MSSLVLHLGATVLCSHGGNAIPTMPSPRVRTGGMPITTIAETYVVAGCPFVPPAGNGPCTSARWIAGASRVTSDGHPVAIQSGASVCMPTNSPLRVVSSQTRVLAT